MSFKNARRALSVIGQEQALRTRLFAVSHLLAGNFGAAGLSLLTTAFAARTLGPAAYGTLALVTVYVQTIERLLSFQTWQPLIRYGAEAERAQDSADFRTIVKFAFLLDLSTAVGGFALAVTLALMGQSLFGWSEEISRYAVVYAATLLIAINGTPVGVLRLAGRFRAVAYVQVVTMSLRVVLSALGYLLGWPLMAFVLIWASTQALGAVLLLAAAGRELAARQCLGFLREPMVGLRQRFPGIWRFSLVANFGLTLRASSQQVDVLLVGAIIGPAAAGFYHIAKRVAKFAEQAGGQLQVVVFPELARLWAAGERAAFRRAVVQSEILIAAACVLGVGFVLVVAEPAIVLFAGNSFAPAGSLLKVQIVAIALFLCGTIARSGLLALGRETEIFWISLAGAGVFFAAAPLLLPRMGAMGANVAHVLQGLVWLISLSAAFLLALRRTERAAGPGPG